MKKDFIAPILALAVICAVIAGALAAGNAVTLPIIQSASDARALSAMERVIPNADAFVQLETDNLPKTIAEAYITSNNTGYIFIVSVNGYGGEIRLICAIGTDGRIIKTETLAETETKGIATPVFEREHLYIGMDSSLNGIDAVSGATITSNAYKNGILDAFEAYEIIKGAQA
ncbi:MAG: FMN-binding protein [Oscillospiraceae bacterium]|nr:FMN-binding protein [Oscillospiraceae bacterium]